MEIRHVIGSLGICLVVLSGVVHGEDPALIRDAARVQLIGVAGLPGAMSDRSGLAGEVSEGIPQNRFGGISAIDQVGRTNEYLMASDRGPQDGMVDYQCRWHRMRLVVDAGSDRPVSVELLGSQVMTDSLGNHFTGMASAIDPQAGANPVRLDSEGLRIANDGTVWISDEYGPQILHFDAGGKLLSTIHPTSEMRARTHAADFRVELTENVQGRMPNRGMEGLALCDDGATLVAVLQSPLIQDSEASPSGFLTGENCRIVRMDASGGNRQQFAYHLDSHLNGLSEILAIDRDRFLVIERDSTVGSEAVFKKIMLVDLSGATDVSRMEQLPVKTLPVSIAAATKRVLIDMLDPRFGLAGVDFPEKLEGLAWGPEINGRPSLVVASDNDFEAGQETRFYVFSL